MIVLKVILGIAIVVSGVYCILFPALGATTLCWLIAAFMFIAGIAGIANYIESKNREIIAKKNGLYYVGNSIGALIVAILAVIFAVKSLTTEEGTEVLFKVISILFGLVFVSKGIFDTYFANIARRACAPGWLGFMLLGILVIAFGIMCIVNSFASMIAMGTMIGLDLIIFGISMLFSVGNEK